MGDTETKLADFAVNYKTADVPQDVMHLAKRGLMNHCGVAMYASLDPSIDILLDLFELEGGAPNAMVLGKGVKTSALNAALANGYLGHMEDYDDTHTTVIHPSSPIFPAALSVSQLTPVSGRDLLAAYAIGVEVACRVGLVITQNFREGAQHWHITNTCGVLGAAAAAGRLLGLTPDQMVYAFAIAGTQASGVREVFGSMCKPFHAGRAAQGGTLAALLAQRGFTGTDGIFEGPRGLIGVMATGHDVAPISQDLGGHWELPATGLKPYACGAANHGFLDAVLALREKDGVSPETVQHIQGSVPNIAPALVRRRHPATGLESKFCYYHSIAVGLIDGAGLPAQFTDARATDPAVEAVRNVVDINEDKSLPRRSSVVTVELKDGTSYTEQVDHASGTPDNPLSDEQVQGKFASLAAAVLPAKRAESAAATLWAIDEVGDVKEKLLPLLSA